MMTTLLHEALVLHLQTSPGPSPFGDIQPEAPPGSNGLMRLMRWLMWGVMLAGLGGIIFAGGKFAWEKWNGGALESPKMVVGALVGGIIAASAGSIMNAVVLTK